MTTVVVPSSAPALLDAGHTAGATITVPAGQRPVLLLPHAVTVQPGQSLRVTTYRLERLRAASPSGVSVIDVALDGTAPVADYMPAGPIVTLFGIDAPGVFVEEGGGYLRPVQCWSDDALTQPVTFPLPAPAPGTHAHRLWVKEPRQYVFYATRGPRCHADAKRSIGTNVFSRR